MNFNALIAVLVIKGVLTNDEAEKLVDHLNDKPQSTVLRDAITAVSEVIGAAPQASVLSQMGPVGPAQQQEELAARNAAAAPPVADPTPPPEPPAPPAPAPAPDPANETVDSQGPAADPKPDEVKQAEKDGGETFTPETDKDAKATSVKKPTDSDDKK